jgi:hypothetical protein
VPTQEFYELLVIAVVLILAVVAIFLFAIQRLRRRKAELLGELKMNPRLHSDRAFNRLEMARREAAIVQRQGMDVSRAQALIARAQAAFDLGKTGEAYELAQSAHEALVAVRHGTTPPPSSTSAPLPPTSPSLPPSSPSNGGARSSAAAPTPVAGLPKNRMESQFEIRMLDADLSEARRNHPSDPATLAATEFQGKAQRAFASGHYSEAFSYALKGRRNLGGNLGAVGPTPGVRSTPGDTEGVDADRAADRAASAARCPQCGYPTLPDDAFCRGCGTPHVPTACPQCGASRLPGDTFCGRCGVGFS